MRRILANIEPSAFRPGEYIGWAGDDGAVFRITRDPGTSMWTAVERDAPLACPRRLAVRRRLDDVAGWLAAVGRLTA